MKNENKMDLVIRTVKSVLLKAFGKHGATTILRKYWIQLIQKGSSEKRVEFCVGHKMLCVTLEQFKATLVVFRKCQK